MNEFLPGEYNPNGPGNWATRTRPRFPRKERNPLPRPMKQPFPVPQNTGPFKPPSTPGAPANDGWNRSPDKAGGWTPEAPASPVSSGFFVRMSRNPFGLLE